jgi:hypothetical protein
LSHITVSSLCTPLRFRHCFLFSFAFIASFSPRETPLRLLPVDCLFRQLPVSISRAHEYREDRFSLVSPPALSPTALRLSARRFHFAFAARLSLLSSRFTIDNTPSGFSYAREASLGYAFIGRLLRFFAEISSG